MFYDNMLFEMFGTIDHVANIALGSLVASNLAKTNDNYWLSAVESILDGVLIVKEVESISYHVKLRETEFDKVP